MKSSRVTPLFLFTSVLFFLAASDSLAASRSAAASSSLWPFPYPSASTTSTAGAGQWKERTYAGVQALIYTPPNFLPAKSPLMISLHGCAQTADDLRQLANWEPTADKYGTTIVLPRVPNGGKILGCWDYYGPQQNEKSRDVGPLVKLTEAVLKELKPDPDQVYISGLSSGAAEAALMACFRPDLFAGVGISSGPLIGTDTQQLQNPNQTAAQTAELCQDFAGVHAKDLETQLTSIIVGDADYIVNNRHSQIAAEAMADITKATKISPIDMHQIEGANTQGSGELFSDAAGLVHVSLLINTGLGHAWPSGSGSGQGPIPAQKYVNGNSINYPAYLMKFFTEQSLRTVQAR